MTNLKYNQNSNYEKKDYIDIDELINAIKRNKKVCKEKNLSIINDYSHQIIVASSEGANKDELNYYNQELIMNNKYTDGWIFIN